MRASRMAVAKSRVVRGSAIHVEIAMIARPTAETDRIATISSKTKVAKAVRRITRKRARVVGRIRSGVLARKNRRLNLVNCSSLRF